MSRRGDDANSSRQQLPRPAKPSSKESSKKKTSQRKDKAVATSSNPRREEEEPQATTAPWPKEDNMPIARVPDVPLMTMKKMQSRYDFANRKYGDPWAEFNSICYNGLLRVQMCPTKFVCGRTLDKLGIADDVQQMLARMGFGTFASRSFPLYPELVRQFLASVELQFEDSGYPRASAGRLTYFSSGILYEITIRELCDLYGFERDRELVRFPSHEEFPEYYRLWNLIGSGPSNSRDNKLSLIRNPAVRILAKILGHTLFAKEETGSLRDDELMLIHFALPPFVQSIYTQPPPSHLATNLGVVFANVLVQKKFRGLNTSRAKVETVGSLLTPIFQFHQIDLTQTECIEAVDTIDEDYLKRSFILKPGYKYQFTDRQGIARRCQLPQPEITAVTSIASLEFVLPDERICSASASAPRLRGSSSRATFAPPHLEDSRPDTTEQLLPPYSGEFDLLPLPPDVSDQARWDWMVDSQRKNNSMMQRIWGALAKLQCPRPPSCFRASETTEPATAPPHPQQPDVAGRGTTEDTDTEDAFDPDVAGRGTTEDTDTEDHGRLSRRRRAPGESHSHTSDSDY